MPNAPVARQRLRGWIAGPATVVGSLEEVRVGGGEILPAGPADAHPGDCHWRTAVVRHGDGPGDAAVNRVGGKEQSNRLKGHKTGGLLGPPCARMITATAAAASTTATATPMAAALGTNRAAFRGACCSLPVRFGQFNACSSLHPGRWLPDSCRCSRLSQDWPEATPQGRGLDAGGGRRTLGGRHGVGGRGSGHGFLRWGLGDRRVRVARAPGLTSVRGTALAGSGDMMIDGVVPLGGCGRAGLSRLSASGVNPGRAASRNPAGRRPREMATVHRLREGRRFHPHQPHQSGTGV